ncbi:phosphatidylinositol glycan [Mitosporidium daphniae]|uniref:GPI ethanolamine phosphate transferase 1 n=1 Tax=Mitosporidium daphniae TaxID=1485682 RepID=A0A098VW79_9MICR|nr:phosphatidylinositol glycan [Mitosporidium daphniae]KGG53197.1 phosphatidylinositol glycan [Mitosporidium daphniae]|eukprot:XP_013239635.1 phosphatidylinositol glycan [Mitosporidium daphniae]
MNSIERKQHVLCYKIAFLVLGIGIIFHLILYNSISDIYCNESPIASSISTIPRWNIPAPSTRVVIFLVDCLRAEQLFSFTGENGTFLAPFIAEQSLREGTWGLVSRPMNKFDDTNTMFTGIQPTGEIKGTIPVDSVFNQSSRLFENIAYLDTQLRKVTLKFAKLFANDNRSTFILTSAGNGAYKASDDPQIPFVAWGDGINKPVLLPNLSATGSNKGMDVLLKSVQKQDIDQVDVASLVSFLLGIPIPVNSIGRLPVKFINFKKPADKLQALFINAKQLFNQFSQLEQIVSANHVFFKPYSFSAINGSKIANISEFCGKSVYDSLNGQDEFTEDEMQSLFAQLLDGLKYLYTYEWQHLRIVIFLGYLGWIFFSLIHIMWLSSTYSNEKTRLEHPSYRNCAKPLMACMGITIIYFLLKRFPVSYYFYYFFALGFWIFNFSNYKYAMASISPFVNYDNMLKLFLVLLFQLGIVLAYYERWVLSVMLVGLTFLYSNPFYFMQIDPIYHTPSDFDAKYLINRSNISSKRIRLIFLSKFWIVCSILFSIFPILQVDAQINFFLYYSGLLSVLIISVCLILYISSRNRSIAWSRYANRFFLFMVCLLKALWCKIGLVMCVGWLVKSDNDQYASHGWYPSGGTYFDVDKYFTMPKLTGINRFLGWALFSTQFQFNGCILAATLFLWIFIEGVIRSLEDMQSTSPSEVLGWNDLRLACMYIFFQHLAIFGVDSISNLSSFSLPASYRLATGSDSLFVTRFLFLVKEAIPVILVSIALIALERATKRRSFLILIVSGMVTDFVNMVFFFMAMSADSWLTPVAGIYRHSFSVGSAIVSVFFYLLFWLLYEESEIVKGSTASIIDNGRLRREKYQMPSEEFEF